MHFEQFLHSSVDPVLSILDKQHLKMMTELLLTISVLTLTLGCRSEILHFRYDINENTTLASATSVKLHEMREFPLSGHLYFKMV